MREKGEEEEEEEEEEEGIDNMQRQSGTYNHTEKKREKENVTYMYIK